MNKTIKILAGLSLAAMLLCSCGTGKEPGTDFKKVEIYLPKVEYSDK